MAFTAQYLTRWLRGCVLLGTPDTIPPDALRRATNVRLDRVTGAITPRPGWTAKTSAALAGSIGMLSRLFAVAATYGYAQIGSTLYRLNSSWGGATSISTPGTTLVSDANSPDGNNNQWKYLVNQTVAVKDNGTSTQTMGLAAPTAAPTTAALATDLFTQISEMDAAASWTGSSVGGLADDAAIFQETPSAITFTVAASTFGSIAQRLGADVNLDTLTGGDNNVKDDDYIFLWVRVDRPERVTFLQLDVDVDSASTVVGDAFRRNYYSVLLSSLANLGQGINGWTKIQVRKNAFTRYGADATRTWANARTFRIGFLTNALGTITVHLDDFKLRGGVGIEGQISYTVCYRNSTTGGRGNPPKDSDGVVLYTTPLTVDRQRVNLTITNVIQGGAAHPGDTQIDKIMVWRKGGAFTNAVLVDTIDDTSASPYLDAVSDETLVLTNQELETDNDVPPTATTSRLLFGPDGAGNFFMLVDGIRLYISKPYEDEENRIENWPADAYALIGDGSLRALAGRATTTQTLVWTGADTYEVTGFGADTLLPVVIEGSRGIVGRHAHTTGGNSIFFVAADGVYEHRGRSQRKLTGNIDPFFQGRTVDGQLGWNTAASATALTRLAFYNDPHGVMLVMLYCDSDSSTLNAALVLKPNPENGSLTECFFDTSSLTTAQALFMDDLANELLVGGANGYVYQIEDADVYSDAGTAIAMQARTRSLDFDQPTRHKFIAHAVLEGDTSDAALTVRAYYDRNTVFETLSNFDTTSVVAHSQHSTTDPEARYRDVAIDISGSVSDEVQVTRIGVFGEAQPEAVTYLDSGEQPFEFVQQCKRFLVDIYAPATTTLRVYTDGTLNQSLTILANSQRTLTPVSCPAGVRGRSYRLTLTSASPFLHYRTVGWFKTLGGVQGYQERALLEAV